MGSIMESIIRSISECLKIKHDTSRDYKICRDTERSNEAGHFSENKVAQCMISKPTPNI